MSENVSTTRWAVCLANMSISILALGPFLIGLFFSFYGDWDISKGFYSNWGTISQYTYIFEGHIISMVFDLMKRSTYVALVNVAVAIPSGYILVRAVSYKKMLFFLVVITLPLFVSPVIRAFSWYELVGNNGFISYISGIFGLSNVGLYGTELAIVLALISNTLAIAIFPVVLGLMSVNNDVWKSCDDMKFTSLDEFVNVAVPNSVDGAIFGLIGSFSFSLSASAEANFLGTASKSLNSIVTSLLGASKLPSALALLNSITILLLLLSAILSLIYVVK